MQTIHDRNAEAMAVVNGSRLSRKEQGILSDILFEWWTLSRKEVMAGAKLRRRDGRPSVEIG